MLIAIIAIAGMTYKTSTQNWDITTPTIKEITWASSTSFDMVVENSNDFTIFGTVFVDSNHGYLNGRDNTTKIPTTIQIPIGESVIRVTNLNIDTQFKRQGNMVIKTTYLSKAGTSTSRSYGKVDNRELLRKVIDLPYVNVIIQSSTKNMLLDDKNQYLTLTNIGNVPERFTVDSHSQNPYQSVGVTGGFSVILKPNVPVVLPLTAYYSSEWIENGTSVIEVETHNMYSENINDGKIVASIPITWNT